jgi:hypothetical protein
MIEDWNAVLRPLGDVFPIETEIECFCQDIKVDVVVVEEIKHSEWSDSGHFNIGYQIISIF